AGIRASMGPRSENRGYVNYLLKIRCVDGSFNGSTVREPWLCSAARTALSQLGSASMGPRSENRGYGPARHSRKRPQGEIISACPILARSLIPSRGGAYDSLGNRPRIREENHGPFLARPPQIFPPPPRPSDQSLQAAPAP